jgi:hypothetical protein
MHPKLVHSCAIGKAGLDEAIQAFVSFACHAELHLVIAIFLKIFKGLFEIVFKIGGAAIAFHSSSDIECYRLVFLRSPDRICEYESHGKNLQKCNENHHYPKIEVKNISLFSALERDLKHSGPIPVSIEDGTVSVRLHLPHFPSCHTSMQSGKDSVMSLPITYEKTFSD